MRTITLEEHFAPPGFLDGAGRQLRDNIAKTGARGAKILEQLVEIDDKRIADMDTAGIDRCCRSTRRAPSNWTRRKP
jgi:hypothetical protein